MSVLVLALALATQPYDRFHLTDAANDAMTTDNFLRCVRSEAAVSVPGTRDCIAAEHRRRDRRLNIAYRAATRRLGSATARLRLRDLERRWLATRWDACRQRHGAYDGTDGMIAMDFCALDEVNRRIAWLERYGR